MGLVVERFLMCDDNSTDMCYENFGVDERQHWRNARELRKSAKRNDWTTNGTHDWCPECSAERKKHKGRGV